MAGGIRSCSVRYALGELRLHYKHTNTHNGHMHTHTHMHTHIHTCMYIHTHALGRSCLYCMCMCSESVEEEVRVVFTDEVYQIEHPLGPAGANGSATGVGGWGLLACLSCKN